MPDPEETAGTTEATETTSESTVETAEVTAPETGTTAEASSGSPEESFFDPTTLSPELLPAYKQMQGHFTKSMQSLKSQKDKIAAYDAFQTNPQATLQQLAGQYGLTVQQAADVVKNEFDPQGWDDVTNHVKKQLLQELQPMFKEVQSVKRNSIEQTLDATIPEWREYETEMNQMLSRHPTMADDPVALAKMVIPESVQQGKAMQQAMRKLEAKGKAASVSTGTQTPKGTDPLKPPKNASFNECYEWARKKVAADSL